MKGQNLFFIFLILIAVAGMFLFFNSGTIQYPGHGVWSENWQETSTTTKATIHIVGTNGYAKESVCFENLDGNLYNSAYLSGERFDNSGCPTYIPVVSKFYVQNNKPCIDIMDKHIFDAQCYYNPTDEQVSSGHPYDTKRTNCISSSGAYACYISDVQTTLVLNKKQVELQPVIPPNDFINLPTKDINTDMILWLIAGILGIVALFMILKRR